jgi:hypothetical protein
MLTIEEELDELEIKINRLKMEYEQYFLGVLKREPYVLRGDVQKTIHRYLSAPPNQARTKFRFNSLCARYQSYRQLWGRTMRQIEEGTYRPHVLRAQMQGQRGEAKPSTGPPVPQTNAGAGVRAVDQLYEALTDARGKTGEGMGGLTREKLSEIVRAQTKELRAQHGSGKIRFKGVIEGKRARLRATVVRP